MKSSGMVHLVGAGPGDGGLLTLRGAELLAQAQVVVHDALAHPGLLRRVPADAECISVAKRAGHHAMPQDDINRLLVAKAREGRLVVRLKGGDPFVFGRGGEEAEVLRREGIPFEIVPGVSSVVAAPAYAGIPITHRDHCSSFHVFTGHEDPTRPESRIDWPTMARLEGTRVILMGMERLDEITRRLLEHGATASTPAAVIQWGTTSRQRTVTGTLGDIAATASKAGVGSPSVVVLGGVVALRKDLSWFEDRPLIGRRVVVTRTREQASQLSAMLQALGAGVTEIPTIRIAPPDQLGPLHESMSALGEYNWIVFTSPNGVSAFFGYFLKAFDDIRSLGMIRLAAVGPATAAKLAEYHLRVDAMPEEFVARKVAKAIAEVETVDNLRILCLRAQVATPELVQELEDLGAIVDDVACYQTLPETSDREGALASLQSEGADWITFTSASTVDHFNARVPLKALRERHPGIRFASIGPETGKALKALGLKADLEAKPHTIEGLVNAIVRSAG